MIIALQHSYKDLLLFVVGVSKEGLLYKLVNYNLLMV